MIPYKRLRRFLFWSFVVAFGATTAIVLFFALGYRYSFERGVFVYSGSITLKTIPQNVSVVVDGESISSQNLGILNNSIHITGLMPGEHQVEITAPGYIPWKRHAIVTSGHSTEFWNILLTREQYVATELPATESTLRIFPGPRSNLFALVKRRRETTSFVLLDRSTGVATELYATTSATFDPLINTVSWSPDGTMILFSLSEATTQPIILLNTNTLETFVLNALHSGQSIKNIGFSPNDDAKIFYLIDHDMYMLDLKKETLTPILLTSQVRTANFSGNFLYFAHEKDGHIERFRTSDISPIPERVTVGAPENFGNQAYTLVIYDEDRLILLERGERHRLFIYNQSPDQAYGFREIGSNVADIQFSDDGKKLLFYSRNEINVYFFRPWEVQPERAENSVLQIARFTDPIKSPVWSEDYEHILFLHGKTVKIVELDHRDLRALSDLITLPVEPLSITTSFAENLLYLTFADQSVLSFVFPEPQGLFGQ